MNRSFSVVVLVAFNLVGCISPDQKIIPKPPSLNGASGETNSSQKAQRQKKGRVGYGILATHYDRDGDGIFEEARRALTIYFDRNGDHITDLVVEDTYPYIPL